MIIYLHGFNSSPRSTKANLLQRWMEERGLGAEFVCPALPHQPQGALEAIESAIANHPGREFVFVGSSLGGFYATHFAERQAARAVLINPAIRPHVGLRDWLGEQQNLYSGEKYQLTEDHLAQWQRLFVARVTAERYLLLVETGDEVLDYREALARYRGCTARVIEGGDHTLKSFPEHIPAIVEFAGLAR